VLRNVIAVRRQERRAAVSAVIGDSWYEWVAEAVGLLVVGLVVGDVLPAWALAIAALALFRPLSRLLVAAVRGELDS
jgi:hypothetical protein